MSILYLLDLFGTFAFALSGALVAVKKEMDLFGVIVLALVTAVGGGTLRDTLLGNTPVFALTDPNYVYISLAGAICTFIFHKQLFKINSVILIADAFGLGTFVCIGISKALNVHISFTGAVILGVTTAVVGGMIRDVLAREVPVVLTRDFYAMTCVVGGLLYIILYKYHIAEDIIMPLTAGIIIILRLLAIKYNWNFIKVKKQGTGIST